MQQLLHVAICSIFPEKVKVAITRLCFFFNAICNKVIDPQQLDDLENEASIIIYQLEMYFHHHFLTLGFTLLSILYVRYSCVTTKKTAFYIAQLTSVIAKTDVNESAVAFL